jgi:hypothetical protein
MSANDSRSDARAIVRGATDRHEHWGNTTQGRHDTGFERAAKLLGLSIKHLLWHAEISDDARTRLIPLLDVPLDRFTLQGIRLLVPAQRIPRGAAMRFVETEAQYRTIQDAIRGLCTNDVWPVHYEMAAWNAAHTYGGSNGAGVVRGLPQGAQLPPMICRRAVPRGAF